jgi:Leucine-rich repeat (LRR) protein
VIPEDKNLSFSDNDIESIDPSAFPNLPKLTVLVLNGNKIRKLSRNGFKDLNNLGLVQLKGNQIDTIEEGAFNGLDNLKKIYLSSNKVIHFINFGKISIFKFLIIDFVRKSMRKTVFKILF